MEEITKNINDLLKIRVSNTEYLSNIYNKIIGETKKYIVYDTYSNSYDNIYIYPNWLYNLDINTQKKIIFAVEKEI